MRILFLFLSVVLAAVPALANLCDPDWLETANGSAVRSLLRSGADVNEMCNVNRNRPLHQAILTSAVDPEVVEVLVNAGGDILAENIDGSSVLDYAERRFRLAERNFSPGSSAYRREERILSGINRLLESDAASATSDRVVNCEEWNTHGFFETATASVVMACLAAGVDVAARNVWAYTPLHWVASSSDPNPAVMEALLAAGASPEARDMYGRTPLHQATNPAAVKVLLAVGADIEARRGADGERPLHLAAMLLMSDVVEALVAAGADIEARMKDGKTPLHAAAVTSELYQPHLADDTIQALLDAGANPTARDAEGKTPWDLVQGNEALDGSQAFRRLEAAASSVSPASRPPTPVRAPTAASSVSSVSSSDRGHLASRGSATSETVRSVGTSFRDCPSCPEMVVQIGERLALGRFEVTRGEYAAFVWATQWNDGDCYAPRDSGSTWRDPGFSQTDRDPVVCVSWDDAQAYVSWLSQTTDAEYRLPTEQEWSLAARGTIVDCEANGLQVCNDGAEVTAPVGSYSANDSGLFDMVGNAWEWTQDCWDDCSSYVARGGSWDSFGEDLQPGARRGFGPYNTMFFALSRGFRVARTLVEAEGTAAGPRSSVDAGAATTDSFTSTVAGATVNEVRRHSGAATCAQYFSLYVGRADAGPVSLDGTLSRNCPSRLWTDALARYYTFTLARASHVEASMTSPEISTWISLRQGATQRGGLIDSAAAQRGDVARLLVNLPAGIYTIEASSPPTDGTTGPFLVTVDARTPGGSNRTQGTERPFVRPIDAGTEQSGGGQWLPGSSR